MTERGEGGAPSKGGAHEKRPRWVTLAVVLIVLGIAIGGTGAALAVLGLSQSGKALDRTEAQEDARDAARKVTCDAFNDQQQRAIAGIGQMIDTNNHRILGTVFDDLTPEEQARLDQLYADALADTHETAQASFPLRDCSPEGIAAYYEEATP